MERGKKICEALKEVRRKVAAANGIEYEPTECHHEGECAGTCPKCEAELRALTAAVEARQRSGMRVALAGVAAAGLAMTMSSCSVFSNDYLEGDVPNPAADTTNVDNGGESGGQGANGTKGESGTTGVGEKGEKGEEMELAGDVPE